MVEELADEPEGILALVWKCVNCGDVVDKQVLRNRRLQAAKEPPCPS
jgi:hypothetical protein